MSRLVVYEGERIWELSKTDEFETGEMNPVSVGTNGNERTRDYFDFNLHLRRFTSMT